MEFGVLHNKKNLIIVYFVMLGCYLLEDFSFLMRERKGVDLCGRGEEELGGVEGGGLRLGYVV